MDPLYTIIIPHYNTPELLLRCLESIPVREDVQVIVVDDCSPDAGCYLQKYPALSRPFLEFYSTEKGGSAGRARNVGLRHARGRWCLFADADDYYEEGFLGVIGQALDDELDILYFNIAGIGERAQLHQRIFDLYHSNQDSTEVRYHIWEPWNKVIARKFIEDNRLWFEEIPVGNDALFCLKASRAARRYRIIDDRIYCLTDNAASLSFRAMTFEREMDYTRVRIRINRFLARLRLHFRYGYHVFSISRAQRFFKQYGWRCCLQYVGYVSWHYGLIRALAYNIRRRRFQASHPDLIYCD